MDYTIAYERFCSAKRKQNLRDGLLKSKTEVVKRHKKNGMQLHHMKPLRLNGADQLLNYVLLSREDHAFAHLLFDLALYQRGNVKAVKTLDYGAYQLPARCLKRNPLRGVKIEMKLPGKKDFKPFSLKQAALYYACLRQRDITSQQVLLDSTWAVLKRALRQEAKCGIDFRAKLPE